MTGDKLLEINSLAADHFRTHLQSEAGQSGMEYLRSRGFSDETIRLFGIGFAKPEEDGLLMYLKSKGYSEDDLRSSGLFDFNNNGVIDKFRNRIIFPVHDVDHRVVGFCGRSIDKEQPIYLVSPETEMFEKSKTVFGLDIAKSSNAKNIIICEGILDVIAIHQAGFDQAVATFGTVFAPGHADLICEYAKIRGQEGEILGHKDIMLCFDSDSAGEKAVERAVVVLREIGFRAKVIDLVPYIDPYELIKEKGPEEFRKRIGDAEER